MARPDRPSPLHPDPSRRRRVGNFGLMGVACVAAVVAVILLGGAWWASGTSSSDGSGIGGPFTLVDGGGRTVTDRDLRGRAALIYFGYTFCPDVCPTTLSTVAAAMDALGPDADRVRPVFISIDPQRDTPSVVRDYVAAFSPRLLGLTGTPAQVQDAARAFRVYVAPHRTGDGPNDYTLDHSSILYLMDKQGGFRAAIPTDLTAQAMAAEIRRDL